MWICSKFGFFSVVQKAPDEYHVRARCRKDLTNLKKASGITAKIHRSEPADYRFRMVLHEGQWRIAGAALLASIDYANFKGIIAQTPHQADKLSAYSAFHHDMERWQNRSAPKPVLMPETAEEARRRLDDFDWNRP